MSLGIIIQARMESQRLPGKVYKKIAGGRQLERVISRVKRVKSCDKIVVAIPGTEKNSVLIPLVKKSEADLYLGSLDNVLERYIGAAEEFGVDPIVRITADCPLIDPVLIDQSIEGYNNSKERLDYFFIEGYPQGLGDIEILTLSALKKTASLTTEARHLEHVVTFILENTGLFKTKIIKSAPEFYRPDLRICVDRMDDLALARKVYRHFAPRTDFTFHEIIEYLDKDRVINVK